MLKKIVYNLIIAIALAAFLSMLFYSGFFTTFQYRLTDMMFQNYAVDVNVQLRQLLRAKLILKTSKGNYMLARDFSRVTMGDLRAVLPWKLPPERALALLPAKMQQILRDVDQNLQEKLNVPLDELF